jgi:hypothetical protein
MNLLGLLQLIWNNKNIFAYVILGLIIAFLTWRNNNLQTQNQTLTIEKGKLPDNIEFIAELKGTKFKVTYRDSKNNVVYKEYYIPKEGGVKFTKYIDLKQYDAKAGFNGASINAPAAPRITNPLNSFINSVFGPKNENKVGTDIIPQWYGFTFRPGIAGVYHGGFGKQPVALALDAKLFYINRYSLGLGSSIEYPYVWGSRHVDDFIPFIPVENLEIMGGYGKPYADFGNSVFVIGGRTNF